MNREELDEQLSQIAGRLEGIERRGERRVYLTCDAKDTVAVCRSLFERLGLRFVIATGVDAEGRFEVLYHFSHDPSGCLVTVKALIRDRSSPAVESITPFLPGAEWIEREIHDVLGIDFIGHPNLRRLILADDWPEGVYPLRKDVTP